MNRETSTVLRPTARIGLWFVASLLLVLTGCASLPQVSPGQPSEQRKTLERIVIDTEPVDHAEPLVLAAFERGLRSLRERGAKQALDDGLDEAARLCAQWHDGSGVPVYAARTSAENFYYLLLAATKDEDVSVVNTVCGEAFFLSAYAFVDLGKIDAAQAALSRALALSPVNAHYLAEQGHIFHIKRDWQAALEAFESAEAYAAVYSPEAVKNAELGRAKRGLGYSLIELGRLGEARAKFNECLAINPDDESALHELRYIDSLEANR